MSVEPEASVSEAMTAARPLRGRGIDDPPPDNCVAWAEAQLALERDMEHDGQLARCLLFEVGHWTTAGTNGRLSEWHKAPLCSPTQWTRRSERRKNRVVAIQYDGCSRERRG